MVPGTRKTLMMFAAVPATWIESTGVKGGLDSPPVYIFPVFWSDGVVGPIPVD